MGDPITQQQFTYKSGVRVIIHNHSVIPFPDEDGLDAGTGHETNIAVSKTFINRLPHPHSNCIQDLSSENAKKNSILILMKDNFNLKFYDQKFCLKVCLQMFIIKECDCYDLSLPFSGFSKTVGCSDVDQVVCLQDNNLNFFNGQAVKECHENCPIECKTIEYGTHVSISNYPTQWYASLFLNWSNSTEFFNQTPSFSFLKETTLMVNVFLKDLSYSVAYESPAITSDALLAYVGGTFGLFLGTSLLSLVEILEIVFLVIYSFYRNSLQKKIENGN